MRGQISRWDASSSIFGGVALNTTGAHGTAGATTTSGVPVASLPAGVIRGMAICTAYIAGTAAPAVEFYIDGVLQGTCRLGPNSSANNVHATLSGVAFSKPITAGTHYFYFRAINSTISDASSYSSVSGVITPT